LIYSINNRNDKNIDSKNAVRLKIELPDLLVADVLLDKLLAADKKYGRLYKVVKVNPKTAFIEIEQDERIARYLMEILERQKDTYGDVKITMSSSSRATTVEEEKKGEEQLILQEEVGEEDG
jgi:hypothetical protein